MKYLVTGGAGFIGSHTVDALVAEGHEVVVLDNLSSGCKKNLRAVGEQITFIEGDIRDADTCLAAAERCDGVFHFAALVSVPDSIKRPCDNHEINITGTFNVLEAARKQGVHRVVFASSASVYGDNPELPKSEALQPEPKSPYALAKLSGEFYLHAYAECYGLAAVALRYFNVFGSRQNSSSMYSGVVSIFLEKIRNNLPVTIYGDGLQTRDFVHVHDIVRANLLAMKHTAPSTFSVFNIATGRQQTVLAVLDALEQLAGHTVKRSFADVRAGDIRFSVADISNARHGLNYEPNVGLKEGLAQLAHDV